MSRFGASFRGANFKNANLSGTILRGADLTDATNVTKAQLATAIIDDQTRLLVDAPAVHFDGVELVDWLYAPLLAGASVVLVRGADPERLERIAATERTTRRLALAQAPG